MILKIKNPLFCYIYLNMLYMPQLVFHLRNNKNPFDSKCKKKIKSLTKWYNIYFFYILFNAMERFRKIISLCQWIETFYIYYIMHFYSLSDWKPIEAYIACWGMYIKLVWFFCGCKYNTMMRFFCRYLVTYNESTWKYDTE